RLELLWDNLLSHFELRELESAISDYVRWLNSGSASFQMLSLRMSCWMTTEPFCKGESILITHVSVHIPWTFASATAFNCEHEGILRDEDRPPIDPSPWTGVETCSTTRTALSLSTLVGTRSCAVIFVLILPELGTTGQNFSTLPEKRRGRHRG
ncbi:hypothetical protein BGW80DRAFT_1278787, partial [Lactifluus volemus]